MNRKRTKRIFALLLLGLGGLLIGLYSYQTKTDEKRETYFIQLLWESPGILLLRNALIPAIHTILKEEFGLSLPNEPLFLGKDRKALTLYYIYGMLEHEEHILLSALQSKDSLSLTLDIKAPQNLTVSQKIDFFGESGDELVIMVNDVDDELITLNRLIGQKLLAAHELYSYNHNKPLFTISESEKFPFVPHVGLGRLRLRSVRQLINDSTKADHVIQQIKERIQSAAHQLASRILTPENSKMVTTALVVFSFSKRTVLKEYPLVKT